MPDLIGAELSSKGDVIGIFIRTASVDPALIGAVASGSTAVTIPGVAVGDLVIGIPPDTMTAGLAPQACNVSGANTVQVRLTNASAAGIDGVALVWTFIIFDRTPLI